MNVTEWTGILAACSVSRSVKETEQQIWIKQNNIIKLIYEHSCDNNLHFI